MDKPKVQPKKTVNKDAQSLTEQEKAQEWNNKSMALDEEYGLRKVVSPAFQSRDDGTWSIVLQVSVGKLPSQK